ncbi:MAG TPA: TIGR03013 family XrtA/PEP-CTERM system glycosyltransferase [Steroidobacteraceae bacterium]|nr:TIGR03013 family XrtA/PEP-CTERM system glycosyltransferase [Steroidobacteraceae bacterium]
MRIRFLGQHLSVGLLLLGLAETLAALLACWLVCSVSADVRVENWRVWTHTLVFGGFILVMMTALGLFSVRQRFGVAGALLRITISVCLGGVLATLLLRLWPDLWLPRSVGVKATLLAWALVSAVRLGAGRLLDDDRLKPSVLVVGAGRRAVSISQLRRRSDRRGFVVAGYVSIPGEPAQVPATQILGSQESLLRCAKERDVDEIVVAMDDRRHNFPLRELLACRLAGIKVTELVAFLERETGKVYLDVLNPSWMIFGEGFNVGRWTQFWERAFDLVASLCLLVIASPFLIGGILAIKIEEGLSAPVFYRQIRVGLNGEPFGVLKLRSMRVNAEAAGAQWAVKADPRVTRVGSFIRKVRIDELPQILNVLKGDMSFVGPRPERPEFVEKLVESIPYYSERHCVKPGITGWAQLCYPYGASEKDSLEKLQYDLYYIKNHGLVFDILILLQTVEVVLMSKGAR